VYPTDPTVDLVAENVRELAAKSSYDLSAYWLAVAGSRDDYAARLDALLGPHGMPVLIVRRQRFDNPNSLTEDLARLLEENRATVLEALPRERPRRQGVSIVLLARTELGILQSDSPVIWPEWVPNVGGREVPCLIMDVTRRINVPMAAPEAKASEVNRALYHLEVSLVRRLVAVTASDPGAHQRLFAAIKRRSDVSWADFLGRARRGLRGVSSTELYRPSVKKGDSVISRLWEITQNGSQEKVIDLSTGLAQALLISNCAIIDDWQEGLFGALGRPHKIGESKADVFSRSMVHTVSASCQYITCAVHGHEYQRFPLLLVASVVTDLCDSMRRIESCLDLLPLGAVDLDAAAAN
jgi:hypothetical protein